MRKIHLQLAATFFVVFGTLIFAQYALAECTGICASTAPNGYVADNSGDSDCVAKDASKPYCFIIKNNCEANGGSCIGVGETCSTPLAFYDNECGNQKVCCKKSTGGSGGSGTGGGNGIEIPTGTGLSEKTILEIVTNFLDWLLTVFIILALIAFVITGVQYLLAMGNSRSDIIEKAKHNFGYAIVAVVIVGAGLIILKAIDNFLKASSNI